MRPENLLNYQSSALRYFLAVWTYLVPEPPSQIHFTTNVTKRNYQSSAAFAFLYFLAHSSQSGLWHSYHTARLICSRDICSSHVGQGGFSRSSGGSRYQSGLLTAKPLYLRERAPGFLPVLPPPRRFLTKFDKFKLDRVYLVVPIEASQPGHGSR
jgi:hypothetical protein